MVSLRLFSMLWLIVISCFSSCIIKIPSVFLYKFFIRCRPFAFCTAHTFFHRSNYYYYFRSFFPRSCSHSLDPCCCCCRCWWCFCCLLLLLCRLFISKPIHKHIAFPMLVHIQQFDTIVVFVLFRSAPSCVCLLFLGFWFCNYPSTTINVHGFSNTNEFIRIYLNYSDRYIVDVYA